MAKSARPLKAIPEFGSEAGERLYWETHGTSDYVDWGKGRGSTGGRAMGSGPVAPPSDGGRESSRRALAGALKREDFFRMA